jgi:hypothetical protein
MHERDDRRLDVDERREWIRGRLLGDGRPEGLRYEQQRNTDPTYPTYLTLPYLL